jgi:hypothetical protein
MAVPAARGLGQESTPERRADAVLGDPRHPATWRVVSVSFATLLDALRERFGDRLVLRTR